MRVLDYKKVVKDIQKWIKNYISIANAEGIVIGLSGGIDSSVIVSLCVNAIGKEKIMGVSLPCESILQDFEDAKMIANHLGISLSVFDLTSCYTQFLATFRSKVQSNTISEVNIKPRLRMIALYYIAQSMGNYLVAGTGNRAELAIGYFTKYGDGGVDFEPLGMLYKCEVRELAKILNVPQVIISKSPAPGLWPGQTDEGEIGLSYDTIDEILYRIDYNLGFDGVNKNDVIKIRGMMKKAEHKLKLPPIFQLDNK